MCTLLYFLRVFYSLSRSEALEKVVNTVYEQLQTKLKQGEDSDGCKGIRIARILSALVHLDPVGVIGNGAIGFTLIAEILSSSFSEDHRYLMASNVAQLLGNCFFPKKDDIPRQMFSVEPTWISPLLGFLSLSEKFYATESPPYARSIALRILSAVDELTDSGTKILPILSSTLLPTHPLQSRYLALKIVNASLPVLLSSRMDDVPAGDLKNLLQAVGDPFLFTEDTFLWDRQTRLRGTDYEPIDAAVILINLVSSDLWRNHLRPSNFTTCENFLSAEEGKNTAIVHMIHGQFTPDLPCTAAKVVATIGRLEELQCLKTAEVAIMWAWTVGVFDTKDHDAWELIEKSTRLFYQTHGMGRLKGLERHITNEIPLHSYFFEKRHGSPLCRTARIRPLASSNLLDQDAYLRISQVCQLKRLFRLFGRDPTTREGEVANEGVGKEMDLALAVTPASFVDWACDYP